MHNAGVGLLLVWTDEESQPFVFIPVCRRQTTGTELDVWSEDIFCPPLRVGFSLKDRNTVVSERRISSVFLLSLKHIWRRTKGRKLGKIKNHKYEKRRNMKKKSRWSMMKRAAQLFKLRGNKCAKHSLNMDTIIKKTCSVCAAASSSVQQGI